MKEFGKVCRRRKLNVNVVKRKVTQSVKDSIVREMNIVTDGKGLEEVESFKYLGLLVTAVRGVEAEVHV